MKLIFFVSLICSFAALASEPNIGQLIDQSRKDCDQAKSFSKELSDLTALEDSRHFEDKNSALKVLKKLEGYRATPESSQQIMQFLLTKGATSTETDFFSVWESGTCGAIMAYYNGLRRLLQSTDTLDFSPTERDRIVAETLKHLNEDSSGATSLVRLLTNTALLKLIVKEKLVKTDRDITDTLAALDDKSKSLKDTVTERDENRTETILGAKTFKEIPAAQRAQVLSDFNSDMAQIEPLRKDLREILSHVHG